MVNLRKIGRKSVVILVYNEIFLSSYALGKIIINSGSSVSEISKTLSARSVCEYKPPSNYRQAYPREEILALRKQKVNASQIEFYFDRSIYLFQFICFT